MQILSEYLLLSSRNCKTDFMCNWRKRSGFRAITNTGKRTQFETTAYSYCCSSLSGPSLITQTKTPLSLF